MEEDKFWLILWSVIVTGTVVLVSLGIISHYNSWNKAMQLGYQECSVLGHQAVRWQKDCYAN